MGNIYRLEQRSTKAEELEVKYDALNARIDELQTQYDVRFIILFLLNICIN